MEKRQFKAESKRLLDLMINSIYTNKEIFLRELISNASDAIDKVYYTAMTDDRIQFNKADYYIRLTPDKEAGTLTISDTGIGMTEAELDEQLGTIAHSGSLKFKESFEKAEDHEIIGQFGVGFYAAFMVAKEVKVISKAYGSDQAFEWVSDGAEGYSIRPSERVDHGTDIILKFKEDGDDERYSQYLETYTLKHLVSKYSNYIRYPILMEVTHKERLEPQEGEEDQEPTYVDVKKDETLNSLVPLWRKPKNDISEEDYKQFYHDRHYGYDDPLTQIHMSVEGGVSYKALLYIPSESPYDFYSKNYEKGLELYSSGVLIMDKCDDLIPDCYSFVKGVVDSEDLSLNISREMLQNDRQLRAIAKRIESRITDELKRLLEDDRDKYEDFWKSFGIQIKAGIYDHFGMKKDQLQDLLIFHTSYEDKPTTLAEYVSRMAEDQKYIYYATGDKITQISKLPQAEMVKQRGYEVLYLDQAIDEFALKSMRDYGEKEFKSVSADDLGFETSEEEKEAQKAQNQANKDLFERVQGVLGDRIVRAQTSKRLVGHPVCFSTEGEISIEMEKTFMAYPEEQQIKAQKVLEINPDHPVFEKLKAVQGDPVQFEKYSQLLYDQACLIEGLPVEDPVAFVSAVSSLM